MSQVEIKTHYSAPELAEMKLPGVPTTRQGVLKTASKEGWEFRSKAGIKGLEYAITSLPPEAVLAIKSRAEAAMRAEQLRQPGSAVAMELAAKAAGGQLSLLDADQRRAADQAVLLQLKELMPKQVARFEARRAIVMAWYTYVKLHGMRGTIKLYDAFVSHFNHGYLQGNKVVYPHLEPAVAGVIDSIARRTLQMWVSDYEKTGLQAFVDKLDGTSKRGKCQITLQDDLHKFVVGLLINRPHIKPLRLKEAADAVFAGNPGIVVPSYHAFNRFLNTWKKENAEVFLAISNPDAWKNQNMAAFGSADEAIVRLNQEVQFDSTPADLLLTDGRYCLLGAVRTWDRSFKLLVAKTSRAEGVGALVRNALLDWGRFEIGRTDNGQEYVGRFTGDVFASLGILQVKCPPFQPWHKPHIERGFETFSHDLLEMMPGYIGHNVAERKELEASKAFSERLFTKGETIEISLSSAELQEFCDRWLVRYHNRPHEGLGGLSPVQKAASWPEQIERIDNPRLLDVLLAERIQRTVLKKGLKIDGAWFIAPELAVNLIGRDVQVRLDPVDLGRVYVFHEGDFVCVAECPERTGMNRQAVAQQAKRMQVEEVNRQKRELKALARKVDTTQVVDAILRQNAVDAGKLVAMPKASTPFETQGTRAAAAATHAVDRGMNSAIPPDLQRHMERRRAESIQRAPVSHLKTDEEKFVEWLELDALHRRGESLPADRVKFHADWPKSTRWKVQWQSHQHRTNQEEAAQQAGNH